MPVMDVTVVVVDEHAKEPLEHFKIFLELQMLK
jgi:hypothetical protein